MAHFAQLNDQNIVMRVIVIDNQFVPDPAPQNEQAGIDFITKTLKLDGTWKQTSYHGKFRSKYAAIGDIYDTSNDEFVTPIVEVSSEVDE